MYLYIHVSMSLSLTLHNISIIYSVHISNQKVSRSWLIHDLCVWYWQPLKKAKAGEKIMTEEDLAFKQKQKADAAAVKKAAEALKAKKK